MKYNDLDLKNWQELDINTDSLWIISQRDKSGKHKNVYHGNFIPQIPNQLIQRYTKKDDIVLEPFMGSGTTLFECEKLNRKYIGFDINPTMLDYVNNSMIDSSFENNFYINYCNSLDSFEVNQNIEKANEKFNTKSVQFVLMHPPYMDIVKFTDNENDMS
ncbi:DNA methyltransferase [Aliarcobacter skirrowii]|uniref:DNA methyltransferase n=1 Tax=Aliarcobacter skirrowii TaxID=28200 RepID=UPI0029BCEDBC|nr:DNA methyltransferase [Aliarcobacter skirrowii]MDX4036025.1 DNA methyltransferase [Aliarcobacter skirrowii]